MVFWYFSRLHYFAFFCLVPFINRVVLCSPPLFPLFSWYLFFSSSFAASLAVFVFSHLILNHSFRHFLPLLSFGTYFGSFINIFHFTSFSLKSSNSPQHFLQICEVSYSIIISSTTAVNSFGFWLSLMLLTFSPHDQLLECRSPHWNPYASLIYKVVIFSASGW